MEDIDHLSMRCSIQEIWNTIVEYSLIPYKSDFVLVGLSIYRSIKRFITSYMVDLWNFLLLFGLYGYIGIELYLEIGKLNPPILLIKRSIFSDDMMY